MLLSRRLAKSEIRSVYVKAMLLKVIPRMKEDGLSNLDYKLVDRRNERMFTNITVSITRPEYLIKLEEEENRKAELAALKKKGKKPKPKVAVATTTTTTTSTTSKMST